MFETSRASRQSRSVHAQLTQGVPARLSENGMYDRAIPPISCNAPSAELSPSCDFTLRAYNVPGTADSSQTQRYATDTLGSDPIHITPAHSTSSQVTTPLTKSARRNFQADDVRRFSAIRSTRTSRSGEISWPGLV